MSVILFLVLLSILIIAHEFGHFWVARKCGMKVERFGFGLPFGPTLWSKKIGDVEYVVHAFLVGGYVAFPDDDPESDVPKESPERFENQPLLNRFFVAIAGITVNAIMGWLIMVAVFMIWGTADLSNDVTVYQTMGRSTPAAQAGFESGDILTTIAGHPIEGKDPNSRVMNAAELISAHPNETIIITVSRKASAGEEPKPVDITVTPGKDGKIGINIAPGMGKQTPVRNPLKAAQLSTEYIQNLLVQYVGGLGRIVTGKASSEEIGGPIRIVQMGGEVIEKHGIQQGLVYMAMISVILAVMNILPIPGLDGGHILFIVIEALKGSPLNRDWQEKITQVGFAGLMVLMVFILGNDFVNIFLDMFSKG